MTFLPTTNPENIRFDFIVVSADAYVDHPSFGAAIIGRFVESLGFSVGVIAQPVTDNDYQKLGEPKHAFLVSCGVVDSMVANYSVNLKKRKEDAYSDNGIAGKRPDRVCDVYCNKLKNLYPETTVIAGGIEPSLRRLAHYDYWQNSVRQSILYTSKVDLVVYGMGEVAMQEICSAVKKGIPLNKLKDISGTAYITDINSASKKVKRAILENDNSKYKILSSFSRVSTDKKLYAKAFLDAQKSDDKGLIQKQDNNFYVVINPPATPASTKLLDYIYGLPFVREPHPSYENVPAIEEVKFSVAAHRGCYGDCAFCALKAHQGKCISNRSNDSILSEVESITKLKGFKGYIHDIGGPTANFHAQPCDKSKASSVCKEKTCLGHNPCKNIKYDHKNYLELLRAARKIKGVKKVFVRSGIRFDYIMGDSNKEFLQELVSFHVSGQLKVAPEHVSDSVLKLMNKPSHKVYLEFYDAFYKATKQAGKEQYLVPYFVSSHPGSTVKDAIKLLEYLLSINYEPQQVQDFYPTPNTLSTVMYYTGINPATNKEIFTAKTKQDKTIQRALMQWRKKENKPIIIDALKQNKRDDLIKRIVGSIFKK